MAMNPGIRSEWTAALRSGEYEQGREYLRNGNNGYCCLGVLCELAVRAGVIGPASYDEYQGIFTYGGGQDEQFLPPAVQAWAGLEEGDPAVRMPDTELPEESDLTPTLAELNDGGHDLDPFDFSQIADVIDAQL